MLPPPLPISTCVSVRYIHMYMYMCGVCSREREREGRGVPWSLGCSSWRYSSLSLLPLSDNSGVIQAGVGRAVLGPWWSTMAFRNSFPPSIHLIPIQCWSTPCTHTHAHRESLHSHDPYSKTRLHPPIINKLHQIWKTAPSKHRSTSPQLQVKY